MNPADLNHSISDSDIAIIGMSGRFPGATDIDSFWRNVQGGCESISFFSDEEVLASGVQPEQLKHPDYVKAKAVLENLDHFDANFFEFNPREAEILDPQHRLFLECAWEALETAGYDPHTYEGQIGIYAGAGMSQYYLDSIYGNRQLLKSFSEFQLYIANASEFLATRVAYKLNLTGPAVNVQTACSTSLVAVHIACQSLLSGECDIALAGGVTLKITQQIGYLYQEGMIFSPDGHCRAFDAKAGGTVGSHGAAIVTLKPATHAIADGDYIYALIKGSAINNDGAVKVGYTAPSVDGQAKVITEAQAIAGIDVETITYIEAHGTGTELGDPIELAALTQAFRQSTDKKGFCAIGSLKTNMGHLNNAAGVAGLMKTALALKHQKIPPSLHFEAPNPKIDFASSPFYVNTQLSAWETYGVPRRAAVSSFGIGGTNAHVVLEEAPVVERTREDQKPCENAHQLLVLSAKTRSALDTATAKLAQHLRQHPDLKLADVAYTLSVGRRAFAHRRVLVCSEASEAAAALLSPDTPQLLTGCADASSRSVMFMFPGQGSQYVNMARDIYHREPLFRDQVDRCAERLQPELGLDLRHILYPDPDRTDGAAQQLQQTALAQPALFIIEYSLSQLWKSWGVEPQGAIGHSIGEYVAACLAGVFSLEDALSLVAARGRMIQQLPAGAMLAVPLAPEAVQSLLGNDLSLAVINEPQHCVVSGPPEAIVALEGELAAQGLAGRRLHTSHAFHSQMMEPILEPFVKRVQQVTLRPPQLPFVSNVTGTWITGAQATDPNYWSQHLRDTVQFARGIEQCLQKPEAILLEVGPGPTLSTFAKRHPGNTPAQVVLTSLHHPQETRSDTAFLQAALGQLWLAGVEVNWDSVYADSDGCRIPLPTYPFERQRYWIEPGAPTSVDVGYRANTLSDGTGPQAVALPDTVEVMHPRDAAPLASHARPQLSHPYVAPRDRLEQDFVDVWQDCLGFQPLGVMDGFFELGGDSLIAVSLMAKIQQRFGVMLAVTSLFQSGTIEKQAALIRQRSEAQPWSPLVVLQASGSKSPLFFVHAGGCSVLEYVHVANALDSDQPVYGLEALGFEAGQEPQNRVEDMAAYYLEALQTVQPQGPYHLAAWSFGALVAFEMAQQLQAQGQEVAFLAFLDAYDLSAVAETRDAVGHLLAFFGERLPVSLDHLRQLETGEQLSYVLEQAKHHHLVPPDFGLDQVHRLVQVDRCHNDAAAQYTPRHYPDRIILMQAREGLAATSEHPVPTLGWEALADTLELHWVPGNHRTMLSLPHVEILAEQLRTCMQQDQLEHRV